MTKHDIVDLMRATQTPLIVRAGVSVRKWRFRHRSGQLLIGVTPALKDQPGAYRADVAGRRVPIRSAIALMMDGSLRSRRRWRVKGTFDLTVAKVG